MPLLLTIKTHMRWHMYFECFRTHILQIFVIQIRRESGIFLVLLLIKEFMKNSIISLLT